MLDYKTQVEREEKRVLQQKKQNVMRRKENPNKQIGETESVQPPFFDARKK